MNLKFDLLRLEGDPELGRLYESAHPRSVMLWLGIDYDYAIAKPDIYQWWFINCRNVPRKLPPRLSVLSELGFISEKPIDGEI